MSPIILWNVTTKSRLLAVLRGTEEFLEDLVDLIMKGREDTQPAALAEKVKGQLHQFHEICLSAARDSNLSIIMIGRQFWELSLFLMLLFMQILIYDFQSRKAFSCTVQELSSEDIMCTVPVLDLLDVIWLLNVGTLVIAIVIMLVFVQGEIRAYFGSYQPMFINDLPFGDQDDFNEHVQWDSNFTKHSYELLTMIYEENATIMTQVYVLNALKPTVQETEPVETTNEHKAHSTGVKNNVETRIDKNNPIQDAPSEVDATDQHEVEPGRKDAGKTPPEGDTARADFTTVETLMPHDNIGSSENDSDVRKRHVSDL